MKIYSEQPTNVYRYLDVSNNNNHDNSTSNQTFLSFISTNDIVNTIKENDNVSSENMNPQQYYSYYDQYLDEDNYERNKEDKNAFMTDQLYTTQLYSGNYERNKEDKNAFMTDQLYTTQLYSGKLENINIEAKEKHYQIASDERIVNNYNSNSFQNYTHTSEENNLYSIQNFQQLNLAHNTPPEKFNSAQNAFMMQYDEKTNTQFATYANSKLQKDYKVQDSSASLPKVKYYEQDKINELLPMDCTYVKNSEKKHKNTLHRHENNNSFFQEKNNISGNDILHIDMKEELFLEKNDQKMQFETLSFSKNEYDSFYEKSINERSNDKYNFKIYPEKNEEIYIEMHFVKSNEANISIASNIQSSVDSMIKNVESLKQAFISVGFNDAQFNFYHSGREGNGNLYDYNDLKSTLNVNNDNSINKFSEYDRKMLTRESTIDIFA